MTDHLSTASPDLYEQYPDLYHEYPEVAMHVYRKIEQHSEAWVLENWYTEFLPTGVLIGVPEKEELPFFNPEEHESWCDEQKAEMVRAYSECIGRISKAQAAIPIQTRTDCVIVSVSGCFSDSPDQLRFLPKTANH